MKRKLKTAILIINIVLSLGVSSISTARAEDALQVIVSIVPQKYFLEKIGGDLVNASIMVLPGASPATYEPKPQQMVDLTKSRIYFAIGVPFEKVWLKKFAGINSKMLIVHTENGIDKIPMKAHHHHDEKGRHHEHHGVKDPHIWLAPPLVMIQARNILDALLSVDPANRKTYEDNYKDFVMELVDLDLNIRNVLTRKAEGTQFMVYHPAWGYFAKYYGLEEIPIELEGKRPKPKELSALIRRARKHGMNMIFIQPQFSTKSANTVADAIGGQVMFADPLALDWAKNLLTVAEKFRTALK